MGKATLSYVVKDDVFSIFSDYLVNIDKYTSSLRNERELFDNVSKNSYFHSFISTTKSKGSFRIMYVDSLNKKKDIPVIFDTDQIEIDDIYEKGIVSESELTRRSLLNSKEQLYAKLFLLNNAVDSARKYNVLISKEEDEILRNSGISTFALGNNRAVSIEDLIRYRSTHRKLGEVRSIYEQALDMWKEKMNSLSFDDIYFLSREYRIINNYYNRIRQNGLSVANLNINKKNMKALHNRIKLKTIAPLLISDKKKKNKVMNINNNSNFA
jgi:hypothetical protein